MRRPLSLALALAALAAGPASAADGFMSVQDFQFAPAMVTIDKGDTVDFNFEGPSQHTATLRGRQTDRFHSGTMGPGFTPMHRFRFPGRFGLFCRIHPEMRGVVQVGTPEKVKPELGRARHRVNSRRIRVGFVLSERSVVTVTVAGKTVRRVLRRGRRSIVVRKRNAVYRPVKVTAKDGWRNKTTVVLQYLAGTS